MAALGPSFQSRRLLADGLPFEIHSAQSEYTLPESDEEHALLLQDWNGTAEPCMSLAHLYQQSARAGRGFPALGPTDTLKLHSCAYWRLVGARAIQRFNLTALASRPGFLLSWDDFAAALSQRGVLLALLRAPGVMAFAGAHSPLLKPLHSAVLVARSLLLRAGLAPAEFGAQDEEEADDGF